MSTFTLAQGATATIMLLKGYALRTTGTGVAIRIPESRPRQLSPGAVIGPFSADHWYCLSATDSAMTYAAPDARIAAGIVPLAMSGIVSESGALSVDIGAGYNVTAGQWQVDGVNGTGTTPTGLAYGAVAADFGKAITFAATGLAYTTPAMKIQLPPAPPTNVSLAAGTNVVTASFTPVQGVGSGATIGYKVLLSNGNFAFGATSPISVSSPVGQSVTAVVITISLAGFSIPSAPSNAAAAIAGVVLPPLPVATLGNGYDSLPGVPVSYVFDSVSGATHTLVTTGQQQGAGMVRLKGSGIEGAATDGSGDTVGTSGTLSVTARIGETDPTKLGVVVVQLQIGTTARNASLQNVSVTITANGVLSSAINYAVAGTVLRQGKFSIAIDVQSMMPTVYAAGVGVITVKVNANQVTPFAADLYVDAVLLNSKGRPKIIFSGDDLYKTHRDVLMPILAARNLPLTLFVPTGQYGLGTGTVARLTAAELIAMKAQYGALLECGVNTTLDVNSDTFGTAAAWVADLQSAQADLTSRGLGGPGVNCVALSGGQFTEAYLKVADAAGFTLYRSTRPPNTTSNNFSRYGLTQNCVLSQGNGLNGSSVPTYTLQQVTDAMDAAMTAGMDFSIHSHQVGATLAEATSIGWLTSMMISVADRAAYHVANSGAVACTMSEWVRLSTLEPFPNL